jgi:hypothetical protein
MDLNGAKIMVPGVKKSVRMVDGRPDLRTTQGRAWKARNGKGKKGKAKKTNARAKAKGRVIVSAKPGQGNVDSTVPELVRDEVYTLSRALKAAELHIRDMAGRIRPRMAANAIQTMRDELVKEADRLFFVLYPRAKGDF